MLNSKFCVVTAIIWILSSSTPLLAQSRNLLACETTNTVGLQKVGRNWKAVEFPPRKNRLRSQVRFVIALTNDNKITEESAKEIFGSNSADCRVRTDVEMTYCNDPIGNNLLLSLSKRVGSISDIASVDDSSPEVTVSVFQCQKF